MAVGSPSQRGCYLKECVIPCSIFWPAQGAFIRAAGRERDSALESSRRFPQHLGLKEALTVHLAKCFLRDVKIWFSQTGGVWKALRARWRTITDTAGAVLGGSPRSSGDFWGPGKYFSLCRDGYKPQSQGDLPPGGINFLKPFGFDSKHATFAPPSLREAQALQLSSLPKRDMTHIEPPERGRESAQWGTGGSGLQPGGTTCGYSLPWRSPELGTPGGAAASRPLGSSPAPGDVIGGAEASLPRYV